MPQLIFLVLIGVVFYTLMIRGPRQRARQQQETLAGMEVGDQVVTIGGIIGRITALEGDRIVLEVSPGVEITFLRAGVSRKLEPLASSDGENGDALDITDHGALPDGGDEDERRDGAA